MDAPPKDDKESGPGRKPKEHPAFESGDLWKALEGVRIEAMTRARDFLSQPSGLLRWLSPDTYRFQHWSFLEHLAACDLVRGDEEWLPEHLREGREFPDGLVFRVRKSHTTWRNVVILAGDELVRRADHRRLLSLIERLIKPYVGTAEVPGTPDEMKALAQSAWLGLHLADIERLLENDRQNLPVALDRALQQTALRAITDLSLTPTERAEAGRHLATLGDPRKGVGLRTDVLPDFDWCLVAPGSVTIEDRVGKRKVKQAFQIARFQVTYEQYQAFLKAADGYSNPHWWEHPVKLADRESEAGDQQWPITNHPAENVNWYDAMAFCRWVTKKLGDAGDKELADGTLEVRLPTEAEWQLAAGGPSGWVYPWEPDPRKPEQEYEVGRANIDESRLEGGTYLERTTAVGIYPTGAAECGAWDMSGNVWEWTLSDVDGSHKNLGNDQPRVLRGGSWLYSPVNARASSRHDSLPNFRGRDRGFRVVKAAPVP